MRGAWWRVFGIGVVYTLIVGGDSHHSHLPGQPGGRGSGRNSLGSSWWGGAGLHDDWQHPAVLRPPGAKRGLHARDPQGGTEHTTPKLHTTPVSRGGPCPKSPAPGCHPESRPVGAKGLDGLGAIGPCAGQVCQYWYQRPYPGPTPPDSSSSFPRRTPQNDSFEARLLEERTAPTGTPARVSAGETMTGDS